MLSPFKSIRPVCLVGNAASKEIWTQTEFSSGFCIFQIDFCSIVNHKVHEFIESLSKFFRLGIKSRRGSRHTQLYGPRSSSQRCHTARPKFLCAIYEISLPGWVNTCLTSSPAADFWRWRSEIQESRREWIMRKVTYDGLDHHTLLTAWHFSLEELSERDAVDFEVG